MRESSLCSLFLHLYHLSTSKNCMISDLLVKSNKSVSSFGFHDNLTNRETTKAACHLSLVERCSLREGRKDVRVWSPNPSQGFASKSLFILLLDLSPLGSLFLTWFGGPRFLRKLGSSSSKFCWVGLTLWIGL